MEVVVVMDVQAPAADVGDVHVEARQGRGLRLPHDRGAQRVFVADRDLGLGLTVHLITQQSISGSK